MIARKAATASTTEDRNNTQLRLFFPENVHKLNLRVS